VFVAGIFVLRWNPWCLAIPIVIHFTVKDITNKND
jgi:hypothetical protein